MEDDVMVGGQAGFAGHLKVGRGAKIAGQSGITKDVEAGAFLKGTLHFLSSCPKNFSFTEKIT